MKQTIYLLLLLFIPISAYGDDGSQLWLNYNQSYPIPQITKVVCDENSPILQTSVEELKLFSNKNQQQTQEQVELLIGTLKNKKVSLLLNKAEIRSLEKEGYLIKSVLKDDKTQILIASPSDRGVLYGVFHFIRLIQTQQAINNLAIVENPKYDIRILNHWDNLDGTIERGYAGYSLWKWSDLPNTLSPRYKEYARANASIGINASVLNNVNASPDILRQNYLLKVKSLADIFRPYGVRVYLSVNFSSPKILGGLENSDPLNKDVKKWWKEKAKEIYTLIPDFGGFLVKANSEGQPGPQDYGRTHAEGANMLADVLKPYDGVVMWRAFVYNPNNEDRAKQAHMEFVPLDGQFRDNVIVQIKNGPVDFQPREPFNPLFGATLNTNQMLEFQITQEYLGFSNHLAYLAPLFKETLDNDTYSKGAGSTVAKLTDGSLRKQNKTAIAAVANIGEDANWCGHHFAQANWYAFGRLAWNHQLSATQIADEWLKMTFSKDDKFVSPVKEMMLDSREAVVNYMMPMGLHHIFAWDHHYGPEPWAVVEGARPDWLPSYYHNANVEGLGFDRTQSGSNAIAQYFPPLNAMYEDINTCPENLILWFHHVSWNHKMKSGQSMWDELCYKYDEGVKQVRDYQKTWDRIESYIDEQRFNEVQSKLKIQTKDAIWWKDACLLYFQTFSKQPIPYSIERPIHELDSLKKIKLNMKHHN